MPSYNIFVINPGSTSTKVSLHRDEECLFSSSVFHDSSILRTFPDINDQLQYRMEVINQFLEDHHIDLWGLDAIVGRGGSCYPIESGVYEIDDRLIEDTKACKGGLYHSSMLGVQMANEMHKMYGGRMLMIDPPIVDELQEVARITGVQGVYRRAVCHALNLKETARRHAAAMGRKYEDLNMIVCHIDGGISVTAHRKGRMIDGNDAGGGEGPFTPTRMGTMAVTDLITSMKDVSQKELKDLCSQAGGFSSHFGTSNSDTVHKMVEDGDPRATLVWDAMIYQVIKAIGSMATVLSGKVDAIVLTGGLLRFPEVQGRIEESCGWIAPVAGYEGEFEHEAMANGALRVLRGEEQAKIYPGKPTWDPEKSVMK